ncbi:MAG: ATP-binding cassette domain-containing protein, partial [Ignavibacteriales bacterium]|nr:ATP-binding cassette domain-containing protein [Ignavibacteriales bacterium]
MHDTIIYTEDVCKSYKTDKNELIVLKNISIQVPKAKISVIIGASGAGKSTLLHIISGLDKADAGDVFIDNTNISKMNDTQLSNFRAAVSGFVFQFHHLLPEFNTLENIAIPQMIAGKSKKEALEHASELVKIIGLSNRETHRPSELS